MDQRNKKFLREFIIRLMEIRDVKAMELFLAGILTPKELEEIPTRLQIIRQLKNGVPQRKVAENLGVGIATVSRGARELRNNRFEDE